MAHIVYEGFIDGKALDNAASGDGGADLIIGSKSYIDGFETGLLGAAIGSEVTLDLHFSPYYGDEAVADRDVTFRVRVEHVQRPAFPELTVEKLNELFNASFADLDSVRASLKADMDADQADRAYRSLTGYLQNKAIAGSRVVQIPEKERAFLHRRGRQRVYLH